ncbi:OmpA family protein [Duganella ginsengisoli]|uniref:OmpA family protein n=1 Tax=Pseudoduganella ginsengisoli TaxID=1462440 RepID=A0A6L6Q748_9BURK|nr:OmpA family protein [Pseudoduganella ginsengisoli]
MGPLIFIACLVAAISQQNSAPRERITLLPNQDGKPSAVVVATAGGETVLDQPYRSAHVARNASVATVTEQESAIRARYAPLLAQLPKGAAVFTVYFETDTENLVPESAARFAQIRDELAQRPAPEVVVIGHTDRAGTAEYNDALSLKRAERVRQLLLEAGIPADSISVAGRGEREPAVATGDGKAELRNRRVEIRVR